jgi:phage baseplate assembly protein W
MSNGKTYGIIFPFKDSTQGRYLELSNYTTDEIRSNLTHLLLTKRGSRYYLPDFGTRLYEYIFNPFDGPTFGNIESEIRDSVEKFIPQLQIKNIEVTPASDDEKDSEYRVKVRVDYVDSSSSFGTSDFVIINI